MKTVIFDLDGTLANLDHRLHHIKAVPKEYDEFHSKCVDDTCYEHIAELARSLYEQGTVIVILTGRPDTQRRNTENWLFDNHIPYDKLIMRAADDHRADEVVKQEVLDTQLAHHDISMVFEDRSSCVAMWRRNGIPCLQVAEGDF